MKFTELKTKSEIYYFDAERVEDIEQMFASIPDSENRRRGTANFFDYEGQQYAARHYRRGGVVAKFSRDRYLWTGLQHTRAFRELTLLQTMYEAGLPVAKPVAIRIRRGWFSYTCDLITVKIEHAQTLSEILFERHLAPATWKAIGLCVRLFHDRYIYHADLNASNILIDQHDKIYLLDFDKGEMRKGGVVWKQEVLARLRRSLNKFSRNRERFNFSEDNWSDLINAYTGHKVS